MTVDPITLEVVASRLREVAATMEHVLYHSGYSTILRESKDGTAGLTDARGRAVIVSGGLQYHFTSYQQAVQAVLDDFGADALRPGDSFITNDPYRGGSPHAPDMIVVTPAFHREALVAFAVSVAHKTDIGGLVPGSSSAAAREIYHEGFLLPPVRYQTRDGINRDIESIIRTNSRIGEVVLGDLRAQVGCTRIGVERLIALCGEFDVAVVSRVMDDLIALTARRLEAELASWPDGVAEAEGFLDSDGAENASPVRIHVKAAKTGRRLSLDFAGSSRQTAGPFNNGARTTEAGALLAALAASDPTIPVNFGLRETVDFVLPPGLVVSPAHPAPVNQYIATLHLVYCCVLTALGKLNPARAVAASGLGGASVAIGFARARSGKPTVSYEIMVTSLGGTSSNDGAAIVLPINHFTPGTPVEIVESEYPLRVRAFEMWPDSAGAGRHRGGIGYFRELEVLEDCRMTVRSSNHRYTAWGEDGGLAPQATRIVLNPGSDKSRPVNTLETLNLKAGEVIRFYCSGGAGYGDPATRGVDDVRDDVRNGYVSLAAATGIYRRTPEQLGA